MKRRPTSVVNVGRVYKHVRNHIFNYFGKGRLRIPHIQHQQILPCLICLLLWRLCLFFSLHELFKVASPTQRHCSQNALGIKFDLLIIDFGGAIAIEGSAGAARLLLHV
jgi:hypothetical protein